MPTGKIENMNISYKWHYHVADWRIVGETYIYTEPHKNSSYHTISGSGTKNNKLITGNIFESDYKAEVNGEPWYHFPKFNGILNKPGWLPYQLNGVQIVKRVGDVRYCDENPPKLTSTADDNKESDNKQVPRIDAEKVLSSKAFKDFLRSKMMIKEDANKLDIYFNRMQFANLHRAIGTTREYLFFVKPDLHIYTPGTKKLNKELGNDAFWIELNDKYSKIICQLQKSAGNPDTSEITRTPFMPILTNTVVSSLDLPSINAETTDTPQTIYGTTIQYRQSSMRSDENFDFSLEFYDTPNLEVYHLFKAWDEYEKLKTLGVVSPPMYNSSKKDAMNRYIVDKILHDQIGIYKFIVGDDMETIIYYAYFCGCFPKSVPRDTFKEIESGLIRYSVDWHAQFVEDMNPLILADFNELARTYVNPKTDRMISLWDFENNRINGEWASSPYIVAYNSHTTAKRIYKLKWFNKK